MLDASFGGAGNGGEPLEIDASGSGLVIRDSAGRPLLEEAPSDKYGAVSAMRVDVRWRFLISWWIFRRKVLYRRVSAGTSSLEPDDSRLIEDSRGVIFARQKERAVAPDIVEGELSLLPEVRENQVSWRLRARSGERFLGFGERFNAVDQTGRKLYVWTEEGAVGLGERLGKLLEGVSWNPFPGGPTTAYKPMPFFLCNTGYGLFVDTSARVEFDICASEPDIVEITVWDRHFRWLLFYGPEPARVLELFTSYTGRASVPAPWVFAPWNDAVFGSSEVRRVAAKLRDERIPTSAIWTEDWQGGYWLPPVFKKRSSYMIFPVRCDVDRSLYPDAEELAKELHRNGYRWLSYFLPYFPRRSREYREAEKRGFLLLNGRGKPARVPHMWFRYGHIDLENEEARKWYKGLLSRNEELGFDGWMADFGEYLPPGAVSYAGRPGLSIHNEFPLLWQKIHREFWEERRPDGDYVFFCRSAAPGSQRYAPVFWSGDSNTDFEKYDGLPSNLPAVLSAGLSGLPIWATDIGGYMSLTTRGRDMEVFARWTEFACFLPVMRTHHGTHPGRNWNFEKDAWTLELFRKYARLHTALFPYFYMLAHESATRGLPIVRHLILHFPEDSESWKIEDEFLLGDRVLVAPVIERGARFRTVYFPPGRWVSYWDGSFFEGPCSKLVSSSLENVPVFVRSGKILPTIDLYVDTLVDVGEGSKVKGLSTALSTRRFTLYGPGIDSIELWDGTRVEMWRSRLLERDSLEGARVKVTHGELQGAPPDDELQPEHSRCDALKTVSLNGNRAGLILEDGWGMRLASAKALAPETVQRVTFQWR